MKINPETIPEENAGTCFRYSSIEWAIEIILGHLQFLPRKQLLK